MRESQYVPSNRVAEHIERMSKKTATTKSKVRHTIVNLTMLERETLAENIKTIMSVLSVNAAEFADEKHANLSATTLSRLMNCRRESIEQSTLDRIAGTVGVNPSDLVTGPLQFMEIRAHRMLHEIMNADPNDEIVRTIEKRHRNVRPKT